MKAVGCRLKAVGQKGMRSKRIDAPFWTTAHIYLRGQFSSLATAYSLQPTASARGASA